MLRLTDTQVDAAAALLAPKDHQYLVWYDKEDLGFRAIASKPDVDYTAGALPKVYGAVRTKLQAATATARAPSATTTAPTNSVDNMTSNLALTAMTELSNIASANQSEEKEFIPMDDPRRIYKVEGTPYAYCQPVLRGNINGHPYTPEEQKVVDDYCAALGEQYKNATDEEINAVVAALVKKVNAQYEADRLLTEDIERQQAELLAQREVERRVYYRQKALKEAKKKAKEERKRARAIAKGEMVEEGEESGTAQAQAQASGEGPSGTIENSSAGAHDQAPVTENSSVGAHDQVV